MLVSTVVIAGWMFWWWESSRILAWSGAVIVVFGYALVLALEVVLAAWVDRDDPAPPATLDKWLGAWWREVQVAPLVFGWRQPFRWRLLPDSCLDKASPVEGSAVVFVHGFVCNRGFWAPWMRALEQLGVPYTSVNLEPVFGSIDAGTALIEEAVARAEALGDERPVLVCHSMGGLAARAWMAGQAGAAERIAKVITIGSPHNGTWLARFSRVANGRQMRPGNPWLETLAHNERTQHGAAAYERFVCWYSNTDHIVFPASTATLEGADNRHVPGSPHVALAFHPRVMRESLAMLAPAAISVSARTAS